MSLEELRQTAAKAVELLIREWGPEKALDFALASLDEFELWSIGTDCLDELASAIAEREGAGEHGSDAAAGAEA